MRNLDEHACAVARICFTPSSAPVIEVLQNLDTLAENLMRLTPLHIHDKTHAAGIVFEPGIIEPLFSRNAGRAELA